MVVNITQMQGPYYNESERIPAHLTGKDPSGLAVHYIHRIMLAYYFKKYDVGVHLASEVIPRLENLLATLHTTFFYFYYGLCLGHELNFNTEHQNTGYLKKLKKCLKKMTIWSKAIPANFKAKELILKALTINNHLEKNAIILLNEAINVAQQYNNVIDEAIAHEISATIYFKSNQLLQARESFFKTHKLYHQWGALAKVKALSESYEFIESFNAAESSLIRPMNADTKLLQGQLDIKSLMKASLTLTSKITLSKLFAGMMKVAVENAGAQQGQLILSRNNQWVIFETITDPDGQELELLIPLENNNSTPVSVINYVIRTEEVLVLNDIKLDHRFSTDPLVEKNKICSVLCVPIKNQGKLLGILYMENNLQSAVFNEQRVEFLLLLGGQLGVSLENAFIFENLELKVVERTEEIVTQKDEIEIEKKKADRLLLNILPLEIAEELKANGMAIPRRFKNVSVMFTDFVNFSQISEMLNPEELINLLNHYYIGFDEIISKYRIEKIKTIGDSYMCVSGLPIEYDDHAIEITKAALEIRDFIIQRNEILNQAGKKYFACRIGINSGPVIAGIVGTKKFAYDIWGSTVNIASRMENSAAPGKVNISGLTYDLVKDHFDCEHRGDVQAKNIGLVQMYFVEKLKNE